MVAESSIRVANLFLQIDEFDKEKSDSLPPALPTKSAEIKIWLRTERPILSAHCADPVMSSDGDIFRVTTSGVLRLLQLGRLKASSSLVDMFISSSVLSSSSIIISPSLNCL